MWRRQASDTSEPAAVVSVTAFLVPSSGGGGGGGGGGGEVWLSSAVWVVCSDSGPSVLGVSVAVVNALADVTDWSVSDSPCCRCGVVDGVVGGVGGGGGGGCGGGCDFFGGASSNRNTLSLSSSTAQ